MRDLHGFHCILLGLKAEIAGGGGGGRENWEEDENGIWGRVVSDLWHKNSERTCYLLFCLTKIIWIESSFGLCFCLLKTHFSRKLTPTKGYDWAHDLIIITVLLFPILILQSTPIPIIYFTVSYFFFKFF